jgi:DNA (cytosine-5)-methyltransferase 1
MKAVGITCGIGSMLVGAKRAGFDVVGNVEWREYYHYEDAQGRNTFTANYPGARFPRQMTEEEFRVFSNPDLALGHPECGNFSQLSGANRDREKKMLDPADIPLFVDLVAKIKPRFFVMDDLPRSFLAFPMEEYHKRLPDYDLFPEWVSNWGYGNVQKGRNRMFMIGSLKDERWAFRASEQEHGLTVEDVLGDLPAPRRGSNVPNHDPHDNALDCFRALNLNGFRKKNSWGEVREYFKDKPGGFTLEYPTAEGRMVKRIGFLKGHWRKQSHVLTGGNAILHWERCEPYTIRERARIQGFPDDFVFYGTVLNDQGEWNHDTSMHMVKQTGKAMPVQFCEYASRQVAAHVRGEEFLASDERVLAPNEHVDRAKQWYCATVGYSDQERACDACWLKRSCCVRPKLLNLPTTSTVGKEPNQLVTRTVAKKPVARARGPRHSAPIETKRMTFGRTQ